MRSGFERVDRDIRELRTEVLGVRGEVNGVKTDLHSEIGGTRAELKAEIGDTRTSLKTEIAVTRTELKAEIAELRQWMLRMTLGMTVGFLSVLAAILARGA
jgi:hypothetical protein